MKIRTGFVSNSSSSSFIVHRFSKVDDRIRITSSEQDSLLEKYGFYKVASYYSDQVPDLYDKAAMKTQTKWLKQWEKSKIPFNYGYSVICNQDDVMIFLIENKIAFSATVHYEQYTYIYTPELDELLIATNLGKIMETYGVLVGKGECNCLKVLSGKEYIEKNK